MILIALGSNQTGPWGTSGQTISRALAALDEGGLRMRKASRPLITAPFGKTDQPPFVNAVAEVETELKPEGLMERLHAIERQAGRNRAERWGPRTLDLDLIDYDGLVCDMPSGLRLPHPGIAERIFVLKPIAEIAPEWRHPQLHATAAELLARLDPEGGGREI